MSNDLDNNFYDLASKEIKGWQSRDKKLWIPSVSVTYPKLLPGFYEPHFMEGVGWVPKNLELGDRSLFRLPDENSKIVLEDIKSFWSKEILFKKYKIPYKRGIFMYGPPGCGKSCTIALLVQDVISMGGIVLKFQEYDAFMAVLNSIRKIQPDIPIIALMEDLDRIIYDNSVSEILNTLDGLEQSLNKIVFLATTNRPESIDDNIKNRPSRFDRRIKFGLPNDQMREAYLKHLFGDDPLPNKFWVSKTKGFSLAHLKELFVSVIVLGNNFNSSLLELKKMGESISSEDSDD